jgi:flagellar biosynthesis protein FlhG
LRLIVTPKNVPGPLNRLNPVCFDQGRIAMRDQADELRLLVRQRIADGGSIDRVSIDNSPDAGVPLAPPVLPAESAIGDEHWRSQWHSSDDQRRGVPRKIVVSAGKGGVGTTTVAVNLAVSLGRLGCRTILVDADLSGADATWLCGLESPETIADVLSGRRTTHEVLRRGPGGIQVVPGVWSPAVIPDCSPSGQQRLLRQVDQLGQYADWVIVDAGCGLNHVVRRFWEAADQVLLVTTGEAVAIMDAYAAIKLFLGEFPRTFVQTVVNQSPGDADAEAVHARLAMAARRFLGMTLTPAGSVPWDSAVALAAAAGKPLAYGHANAAAARAVDRLAEQLLTTAAADQEDAARTVTA